MVRRKQTRNKDRRSGVRRKVVIWFNEVVGSGKTCWNERYDESLVARPVRIKFLKLIVAEAR